MELISQKRDWRADWPPILTSAIDERVLACQRDLVALCMQEIGNSGLSPIAYFAKSYEGRQDGDFLAIVESYFALDEDVLANIPLNHAQQLRAIIKDAENDIQNLLSPEQTELFGTQGIRLLLAGISGAGANEIFCAMNEFQEEVSDDRNYKEYFCPKPFEYAEIAQRGTTFLCCPVMVPTPVGNIDDGTFMDVWNSKKAQDIRGAILDGSFSYCLEKTCGMLQEKLLPKRNQVTDTYHRDIIDRNLTVLPKGPAEIVMNYDRSCNLVCPTCRVDKVTISGEQKKTAANVQNWATGEHLKDAYRLHITGSGDALGSSLFHSFLREFDPQLFPQLRISLGTNAVLLTPHTWDRICNEVIDMVVASCDAASPETYALNRGADFAVLVENLHFIGRLRTAGKLQHFVMNFVVQKNNYAEMRQFVELGQSVNADVVMFQQITNWGTFDDAEFRRRAVHHASHPEHARFLSVLQDPIFNLPIVNMFNLSGLRSQVVTAMPLIESQSSSSGVDDCQGQKNHASPAIDESNSGIDLEKAVAVVQSYGKVLELKKGKGGREVFSLVDLSHPKPVIKQALLLVLKCSSDSTERQVLSAAFSLLADFQLTDFGVEGDPAGALVKQKVELERRSLIEELAHAGFAP
jgi:MoaA/NifB/PqqE/SkfB family radical SAM enzyme